jgi:hypothetical protein
MLLFMYVASSPHRFPGRRTKGEIFSELGAHHFSRAPKIRQAADLFLAVPDRFLPVSRTSLIRALRRGRTHRDNPSRYHEGSNAGSLSPSKYPNQPSRVRHLPG